MLLGMTPSSALQPLGRSVPLPLSESCNLRFRPLGRLADQCGMWGPAPTAVKVVSPLSSCFWPTEVDTSFNPSFSSALYMHILLRSCLCMGCPCTIIRSLASIKHVLAAVLGGFLQLRHWHPPFLAQHTHTHFFSTLCLLRMLVRIMLINIW